MKHVMCGPVGGRPSEALPWQARPVVDQEVDVSRLAEGGAPEGGAERGSARPVVLIKGTAIRSALAAVRKIAGEAGVQKVHDLLAADVKSTIGEGVLDSHFYPVSLHASLHQAIFQALGDGRYDTNRRVGYEAAMMDFRGVYRFLLRITRFETVWERMPRAWLKYNSAGLVELKPDGVDHMILEVSDVDGYVPGMWHSVAGRFQAIVEICGASTVESRVIAHSPTGARFSVRWS